MRKITNHPAVRPIVGQSFKGCEVLTLPNQSLTLKEILQRFVRREALPVAKDGEYTEGYGDLEKIARKDITEQMEIADEFRTRGDAGREAWRVANTPPTSPPPAPPTPSPGFDPLNPSGEPKPK